MTTISAVTWLVIGLTLIVNGANLYWLRRLRRATRRLRDNLTALARDVPPPPDLVAKWHPDPARLQRERARAAQSEIDRQALESRGVQIPDTDSARIIAARARTQHVGDQPVRMVWTRGRGWHWESGQ